MTTSATYVRNILKSRIELKLRGVITKPISHSKSFKIPKKLHEAGATLQSTSAALQSINAALQSTNATLQSANATLLSTNTTLQLGNATLMSSITTLMSSNTTLHLGNATLHSLFVGLYLILSKLNPSIIHQIINIKYFIYNVKGLHFNLAFINYNKYRVHLIIFKLLFNRKHQYWAESDYFS